MSRIVTRRIMLQRTAQFSASKAIAAQTPWLVALNRSTEEKAKVQTNAPRRPIPLFSLDEVQLGVGPYREAMERNRRYVLSLDPDRFLHHFRATAGLAPKAEAYGGWEIKVGRMLGHYLSACSMYARATGGAEFHQRVTYVTSELAACQQANGDGYVGGIPDGRRIFGEIAAGKIYVDRVGLNGVHAPWYMLHKMCAGLRDAYSYGQNRQALGVLTEFGDWCSNLIRPLSEADMQKMLEDEHGGMNEIFADLYVFTGRDQYLALSRRFNHTSVLEPLTRGVDDLDGLHANTQIPTVIGLYRQFEVAGDRAAGRGGEFFWETVVGNRSYVIGGNSDKERFYPIGEMGKNLSPATAETCNSYNMVKLTDRLFANLPRETLAAYNERVLWNHILASQDKTTPGLTYYMSLTPGHFKTFSTPYESFWCCVGTGMENHAKYGESIYFATDDGLWINQFIASSVYWKDRGIRLHQETRFPFEQRVQWTLQADRPVTTTVHIRHPEWTEGLVVKVNGEAQGKSIPGSYLSIKRRWRDGDQISAELPLRLRIERMKDDPNWVAICYGPIVLAGLLGRDAMPPAAPYAGSNQLEYRSVVDPVMPFLAGDTDVESWLEKIGAVEFATRAAPGSARIRFVPLADITNERYSVYWRLNQA